MKVACTQLEFLKGTSSRKDGKSKTYIELSLEEKHRGKRNKI